MTVDDLPQPGGEKSREPVVGGVSPVSPRQADFLRMTQIPLEMFPDPVLPDDGLLRRMRS